MAAHIPPSSKLESVPQLRIKLLKMGRYGGKALRKRIHIGWLWGGYSDRPLGPECSLTRLVENPFKEFLV
jgi:hypothetical protein